MKIPKIALIGAQGVGKTTISQRLLETYSNSVLVKETVRDCPYSLDQNADFKTEWWVLSHSILAEYEAYEARPSLIVTDRCLLDISVYTNLIAGTKDGRISDLQCRLIDDTIDKWFTDSPYDLIFFLRVSDNVWKSRDLNDGFRSTDFTWYKTLTSHFEQTLEKFKIPQRTKVIDIHNDGTFEQSVAKVQKTISEQLKIV